MKFNVMKNAKVFFMISAFMILVGLGFMFVKGLNYGIDFRGGTIVNIELGQQFTTDEIKQITNNYDKSAEITYSGDNKTQVVISTKEDLSEQQRKQMFEDFKEKYNLDASALISIDKVSASIGSEMAMQSIWAIVAVVIGILIYVSIRFEFLFAISAIVCLFHDVMIVISVYAIAQIQVNTPFIAAVLTTLGFSINDTIVVFDRIRENRKRYGKNDYTSLVNDSVNQTLRRSINTTATSLIAITALYVLGVSEIRDFALPLIIGFVGGTYSSVCIASPLWVLLQEKFNRKRKLNTVRR